MKADGAVRTIERTATDEMRRGRTESRRSLDDLKAKHTCEGGGGSERTKLF